MTDNRALWELVKLWTNRVVSDDEMEYKNGFYDAQDKCREELAAILERPVVVGCTCQACSGGKPHWSDCAVHNEPALPIGKCDCGVEGGK